MPSRRITRMIVTSFQVSPPRGGGRSILKALWMRGRLEAASYLQPAG
jgi:hypothetical protein